MLIIVSKIVPLFLNNGDISLPVTISPNEETFWVEKDPLTNLFGTTRQNVEYHIENIYNQGELERGATCKEILQVQLEGDRNVTRLGISLNYAANKTFAITKMEEQIFVESIYQKLGFNEK